MADARQRSISMADDDWAVLKDKAETVSLSVSELIRKAVESYQVTAGMSVTARSGELSEATWTLTDEQRAEIAKTVTRDSVGLHYGEPFGVARAHVAEKGSPAAKCHGMVLYWRDLGKWRCRKCDADLKVEDVAPEPPPPAGLRGCECKEPRPRPGNALRCFVCGLRIPTPVPA